MGESSADEYEYYEQHFLSQPEYIETLKDYYPVMFRCLMEMIDMSANLYSAMCQRFEKDLDEINRKFYPENPAGKIVRAEGRIADTHRRGQSVQQLVLDNGETLIYKPHSVKNEKIFAKLVHWIYDKCQEEYSEHGILEKEEYGWCLFVEYRSCTSKEEIRAYYRKLGMNLFTAYFLGTGDLHFENLIAHGSEPVIVDVETLTKMPTKSVITDVNEKIRRELEHSVLYLGLLPFYSWDRDGHCLCHGSSGNVEILRSAAESMNETGRMKEAGWLCNAYVRRLAGLIYSDKKGMLPQEKEHPGLMTGMAGIGYFILFMVDKCMPDILFPEMKNGENKKKVD